MEATSPDRIPVPGWLLDIYPPERDGLFRHLRDEMSDALLRIIAEADGHSVDYYFEALKQLRDEENWDQPPWAAHEVLSLHHGSEAATREDHLTRAFCCCALIRLPDIYKADEPFREDLLAPLLQSCLALGRPYPMLLARYLTWALQTIEKKEADGRLYHAFALVAAVSRVDRKQAGQLVPWFLQENEFARQEMAAHLAELGITYPPLRTFLDHWYEPLIRTPKALWIEIARDLERGIPELENYLHAMIHLPKW